MLHIKVNKVLTINLNILNKVQLVNARFNCYKKIWLPLVIKMSLDE